MKNYSIAELSGRTLLCNMGDGTFIPYRLVKDEVANVLYMCEVEAKGKSRITLKILKGLVENGSLLSKQGEDPIEFMRKTLDSIKDKNCQLELELSEPEPSTVEEPTPEPTPTVEPTSIEVEPPTISNLIITKGVNEKIGNPTLEIKFGKMVSRTLFKLMFDSVREIYPNAYYFAKKKSVIIQDKGGDKHIDLDVAMEKIKGIKLA